MCIYVGFKSKFIVKTAKISCSRGEKTTSNSFLRVIFLVENWGKAEISGYHKTSTDMSVFWDGVPCRLLETEWR